MVGGYVWEQLLVSYTHMWDILGPVVWPFVEMSYLCTLEDMKRNEYVL